MSFPKLALTKSLKKLEVFHLRCVRRILKIKWCDVMDEKITNKEVLERFDIKFLSIYITRRRLILIVGIIRMIEDRAPARLISAFYYTKNL